MAINTIKKKELAASLLANLQGMLTGLSEKNTKKLSREVANHSVKVAKKYVVLLKKEAAKKEKEIARAAKVEKKSAKKDKSLTVTASVK